MRQAKHRAKVGPGVVQKRNRWSKYRCTPEDFEHMLSMQDGLCPVCDQPGPDCVDHDHATGRIRGVLHRLCNSALGQLHDSPANLRRAAAYIELNAL